MNDRPVQATCVLNPWQLRQQAPPVSPLMMRAASFDLCLQVSDFGLSCVAGMDASWQRSIGALTHAAPELLAGEPMSKAADVYAVGVLLWELMTGQVGWYPVRHGCPRKRQVIEWRVLT